jgi:hypothetical protein
MLKSPGAAGYMSGVLLICNSRPPDLHKPISESLWRDVDHRIQIYGTEVIAPVCRCDQVLYPLLPRFLPKSLCDCQVVLKGFLGVVGALEVSACAVTEISENKEPT